MKKQLLVGLGILFISVSCEKCHECHYEGETGEVELGEYCGDDLKNLEENGFTVGDTTYTAHCEEH